jgi:renalase
MKPRIAIIGAGMSGLTLASSLATKADVSVFEKARGVGGRMSTRYADPFYFDHGTQFFTARTEAFQAFLAPLITQGIVAQWQGKVVTLDAGKAPTKRLWFEPHFVAAPNMNSLCKHLAKNLTLTLGTEVAPLTQRKADSWHLCNKEGHALGVFDVVISTAPPVQTTRLLGDYLPANAPIHHAQLLGCYTLMLGFNHAWDKNWIAAQVHNNPIDWISINSSKPQRNDKVTCISALSHNDWAETHIDDDMQEAQTYLLAQLQSVLELDISKADYVSTHRWRYAKKVESKPSAPYFDAKLGVAAVSDWGSASRIEDTWSASMQLATMLSY